MTAQEAYERHPALRFEVLEVLGRTAEVRGYSPSEDRHYVTVNDGRLTISNAPGSVNNKLCFVEITGS